MRRTYKRVFRDTEKLQEMLERYKSGEKTIALAEAYKCDRTVITFHASRAGLYNPIPRKTVPDKKSLWNPRIRKWECCGSRTYIRHLNKCIDKYRQILEPSKIGVSKYEHLFNERVSPGKTYREYLEEDARRQVVRKFKCAPKVAAFGVPLGVVRKSTSFHDLRQTPGPQSVSKSQDPELLLELLPDDI